MSGKKILAISNGLGKSIWRTTEDALKETYEKGKKDGIAEANLNHNIECGDCARQITTADEARIRADERKKVIEKIRELKKHSGNTSFCTKEHCPSHEDIACYDCMDAILNYVEKDSSKEQEEKNGNS